MDAIRHQLLARLSRAVIVAAVITDVFALYGGSTVVKAAVTLGVLLIEANDYFRYYFLYKKSKLLSTLSIIAGILGSGYLIYSLQSLSSVILYAFPLIEMISLYPDEYADTRKRYALMALHLGVYAGAFSRYGQGMWFPFSSYLIEALVAHIFWRTTKQRRSLKRLNTELTAANEKLMRYSRDIEEITVRNERTRIAQELHDSMGHSLIALKMNLEYADNIAEADPPASRRVIEKAIGLSADCIGSLRKAVTVLKEDLGRHITLQEMLQSVFENFEEDSLRYGLDIDAAAEGSPPDIKECIYKTVREAVTNGVKHGKADRFEIAVLQSGDSLEIKIQDNGAGCSGIVKSNGLTGMEKRIAGLGGVVEFSSGKGRGFAVKVRIPVGDREGVKS